MTNYDLAHITKLSNDEITLVCNAEERTIKVSEGLLEILYENVAQGNTIIPFDPMKNEIVNIEDEAVEIEELEELVGATDELDEDYQ